MADRKIIFKCRIGSHLFGTSRPDSDEDFAGVFIPSTKDMLSLNGFPDEITENEKLSTGARNTLGDVDCKYFSLQKFLKLAAEGQSQQLEMLFAPKDMILVSTPEWESIFKARNLFLSKKGISPFIGFALAQAHKAVIKGENLNLLNKLIAFADTLTPQQKNSKLSDLFTIIVDVDEDRASFSQDLETTYYVNAHGFPQVRVAGRDFDVNVKFKQFIDAIKKLEERYGSRSRNAAEQAYDYKSLAHAIRLLSEAEEFLQYGRITLPRPDADYLKIILKGECLDVDWFDFISSRIDYIKQNVEPYSLLPDKPDMEAIDQLCMVLLYKHIVG